MSAASGAVSRLGPTHVHIDYNGSGHAGDQSLPIAELLARMETDAIETFWGDCCSLAHAAAYYGEKDANGEKAYADLGPIYPDTPHAVRFCGECTDCGWTGPPVSTIEEAMRDADAHQCPSQQNPSTTKDQP